MMLPKVGVIGAGSRGLRLSRICAKYGSLGAIAEILPDRLRKARAEFPAVPALGNSQAVFASNVDAVAIATPPHTLVGFALEALARGKHVFVQKPPAMSEEGALAVAVRAERAGRSVFVGHELLYNPAIVAQRALVKSGAIGDIIHIRARRFAPGIIGPDEDVWWRLAPDDVAFVVALLGEPISVAASGQGRSPGGIPDLIYADMHFLGERSAHIEVNRLDPQVSSRIDVFGTRGVASVETEIKLPQLSLHLLRPAQSLRKVAAAKFDTPSVQRFPKNDPLEEALLTFLRSFAGGLSPLTNASQGISTTRALAAVTRACAYQTGEFVVPGTRRHIFVPKPNPLPI